MSSSALIAMADTAASTPSCRGLGLVLHRQLAYAPSRDRKDRIGQSGHDTRRARLAYPAGRFRALYDTDVNLRRLVHAEHAVIAEVRLLNATLLDRDFPVQRSGQAENDAALHLCANGVGIDLHTAIDGAPHACRPDVAVLVNRDFHDLRNEAAEAGTKGDSPPLSGRQRLAPTGPLGSELQDLARARASFEQRQPV